LVFKNIFAFRGQVVLKTLKKYVTTSMKSFTTSAIKLRMLTHEEFLKSASNGVSKAVGCEEQFQGAFENPFIRVLRGIKKSFCDRTNDFICPFN
jgi:hypothetical protein